MEAELEIKKNSSECTVDYTYKTAGFDGLTILTKNLAQLVS